MLREACVKAPARRGRGRSPPQLLDAPAEALAGGDGATDDEDGVVAGDGTDDVGDVLAIQGPRHGLGAARRRAHDEQLRHAFDRCDELRDERFERRPAAFVGVVALGPRVADALSGRHSRQSQLVHVARECRLRHVEATLAEQSPQVLLRRHRPGIDELEYHRVALLLGRHVRQGRAVTVRRLVDGRDRCGIAIGGAAIDLRSSARRTRKCPARRA